MQMTGKRLKRCRNSVDTEIKQTKESYYKNALHANEGDFRQTWRIINELTRKATNCCVKDIENDDKTICDSLELADILSILFYWILANEINSDNGLSHLRYITRTDSSFEFRETSYSKVFSLLSNFVNPRQQA